MAPSSAVSGSCTVDIGGFHAERIAASASDVTPTTHIVHAIHPARRSLIDALPTWSQTPTDAGCMVSVTTPTQPSIT